MNCGYVRNCYLRVKLHHNPIPQLLKYVALPLNSLHTFLPSSINGFPIPPPLLFLLLMDLTLIPYHHIPMDHLKFEQKCEIIHAKTHRCNNTTAADEPPAAVVNPKPARVVKYRECMRNHAASMGVHASDGCGEFMPSGGGNSKELLTCAACGCHRNFHRREIPEVDGGSHAQPLTKMLMYKAVFPKMGYQNGGGDHEVDDDRRSETPERDEGQVGPMRNKRFRTKFTAEQKERMLHFAERIGWRLQKQYAAALTQFCSEIGVKRNVLKVWMHNNKNVFCRRDTPRLHETPLVKAPPPPPPASLQAAVV